MKIRVYRNIPTPSYMYEKDTAHNTPLKIELGKHWEIYVTRETAERVYPWFIFKSLQQILFKDRDFIRHVKEAEIIPFWYGYAYYDFNCDNAAYMPVPLNFIAAAFRWLKHKWFGFKQIPRGWNSTQEAYGRGYKTGYEEGFNEASSK